MSIFAAPNFYNQADQNIYDSGDRFITQEKFRFGLPIQKNISFSSPSTSGIAGLPVPILPLINQGGGGGDGPGGGIDTSTPEDQSTTSDDFGYGLEGNDPSMNMTDEEKDAIDAYNNPATTKGMMGTIGATMFGFMNPLTAMFSLNYQRNKVKEAAMQKAKEAAMKADFERAKARQRTDNPGGKLGGPDGQSGGSFTGGAGFASANSYGGSGTADDMGADTFAYGGRVPYMMGGLANLVDIYD